MWAAALVAACGGGSFRDQRETAFGRAVEASVGERWATSANAAFGYLEDATADDERYDRALILLAQALDELHLTYPAALFYTDVAQSRRNVELLDKAVGGLERIVSRTPYDEPTVLDGFLATAEITGLRPELAAFVDFVQGRDSLRKGLVAWANQSLHRIPTDSPYFHRARYVRAIHLLAERETQNGAEGLRRILRDEETPEDIVTEARLALARLALEEGRYDDAVAQYEMVKRLAPERPYLLLEMAWAHYYRGDSRRALGLLIALDAPVYGGLIAPERYLLEAFCLRRLCQFEPARIAAARLHKNYGEPIEDLYRGVPPAESAPLRAAALRRGQAQQAHAFLRRLRAEQERMDSLSLSDALHTKLKEIYRDGEVLAARREEAALAREVESLAEELVAAEDGVRLILHELSVALLRGRKRPEGPPEIDTPRLRPSGDRVSYRFVNEFWTDELDDLLVIIEDRCLE